MQLFTLTSSHSRLVSERRGDALLFALVPVHAAGLFTVLFTPMPRC
jgi:hypothetical protein